MTPRPTTVRRREHRREDSSSAGDSRESAIFDNGNRSYHSPPRGAEERRSRAAISKGLVLAEMRGKTGEGSRTQKPPTRGMAVMEARETSVETKRGAVVVGSPYMSRAERAKEVSKETARLRYATEQRPTATSFKQT